MIVFLEAQGTNAYNRYAMCPAGHGVTVIVIVNKKKEPAELWTLAYRLTAELK